MKTKSNLKNDRKENIKELTGLVVKLDSGIDTIKVRVERVLSHPKYGKLVKRHKNFLVHIEESKKTELSLRQQVKIIQVKPISKNKTWRIA